MRLVAFRKRLYSDNNARQRSSQLAMGEGLADIFGEFVEDYSDDGKYNGSCSWTNPVRSMNNRTDILNHNGILQAKDFQDGTTDCHQGASLISYPTYLMATGVDGDSKKAISDTKFVSLSCLRIQTNQPHMSTNP